MSKARAKRALVALGERGENIPHVTPSDQHITESVLPDVVDFFATQSFVQSSVAYYAFPNRGDIQMPGKRERALHYRRVKWLHDSQTLESYARQAVQALNTVELRTIDRGEGQFIRFLRTRRRQAGGIFLHLTADTPGESASTIPKQFNQADLDVGASAPPVDSEYMDSDAFVFIRDNNLCYCASAMRDGGIAYSLGQLFEKADLGHNAKLFSLEKVADAEKIALIQERGVKEVVLNATLYEATSKYNQRHSQPTSILRSIGRVFYSLRDDDNESRMDNLSVYVSISADGRVQHNSEVGYARIEEFASQVVETQADGDSYTIITKDGQKISAAKITLHKTVKIASQAKSIAREPAWSELLTYYQELAAKNFLEH